MTVNSVSSDKPQQVATVGTKITLISKAQVRYEGALFSVDPVDGTVGLARVKVLGTENRKNAPKVVPPLDETYAYILFRGTDIQDLTVNDSNSRDVNNNDRENNVSSFLTDPVIIRTTAQPPTDSNLGNPQVNNILPSDDSSNRNSGRHQYFHPDALTSRTRNVSENRAEQNLPRQNQNQNYNRRGGQFYRDYGDRERDDRMNYRERERDDMMRRRGPGNYGWQNYYDYRYDHYRYPPNGGNYYGGGYTGGFDNFGHQQPPQRVVFLPRGATRTAGQTRGSDGGRREPPQNQYGMQYNRQGQRPNQPILRRPVVMYARQPGPIDGQTDNRGPPQNSDFRRPPQRQRNSSGYYQREGFRSSRNQNQNQHQQRSKEYLSDYDFEKMNAELEQEYRKEPDSDARNSTASPEKLNGDVSSEAVSPSQCYDKQSSFFDKITRVCEAGKSKVVRADERRINEETFGRQYRTIRRGRRSNQRQSQYY